MRSDYEIKVFKELRRGESDPERIYRRTGVPIEIVKAIIKHYKNLESKEESGKFGIDFSKGSINLLLDLIILYVLLRLIIAIMGGA